MLGHDLHLPPDLVLLNGSIFTCDQAHPRVEALAILADRIVAVGATDEISSIAGTNTRKVDLDGRVVIPGINDSHTHFHSFPSTNVHDLSLQDLDPTWPAVSEALTAVAAHLAPGTEIVGDIGPSAFDSPDCNRANLDRLTPHHPVRLGTWSGHALVLNSQALAKLGIREDEVDPVGGRYERSASGELTGVIREYSVWHLYRKISDTVADSKGLRDTRSFLNSHLEWGVTSIQCMPFNQMEQFVPWCERASSPIRVRVMRMPSTSPLGRNRSEGRSLRGRRTSKISVSGTKWFLDGGPVESSSAMREPYTDNPYASGILNFTEAEMEAILRESLEDDDQLLVHATGDRAVEKFLDALDATGGREVWSGRRVRIEHGEGILPDFIPRVKELGLVVVQNPKHFAFRDLAIRRFGVERTEQIPFRSLLKAGISLALGSDSPLNPYLDLMFASQVPGKPQESLTREQAVNAYTLTAAYAEFEEKDKGSIVPGKVADLAVLSQDIFTVPPEDLPKTRSVMTVVGGTVVFDAGVIAQR